MQGIPAHDEQGTGDRSDFLRVQFKQEPVDALIQELGYKK
tara:strand:- start:3204 stop:3323 length:120 start_codon:yes stop_codon:yes gene_type:complete